MPDANGTIEKCQLHCHTWLGETNENKPSGEQLSETHCLIQTCTYSFRKDVRFILHIGPCIESPDPF